MTLGLHVDITCTLHVNWFYLLYTPILQTGKGRGTIIPKRNKSQMV